MGGPADPNARYCRLLSEVELLMPAPNPMFTEAQRRTVRFMRFYERGEVVKVKCAHCGHKKSILWTQLCSFRVCDMGTFVVRPGEKVYPPLTPVCQTHLMAPELEEVDKDGKLIQKEEPKPASPAVEG
jgi:hypothetical protein